ncbi:MAG: alkaline phosphatase family protein, partial [Candidatus Binatia bacterium]
MRYFRKATLSIITFTLIGIAVSFLMSCSEAIELVTQGGEKPLRNKELPPPGPGPRVLLFALDGVGYDEFMQALRSGQFSHLQALLGTEKKDGLFAHGYSVPDALTILPSTTMAAWSSVYTGEPPARTGVPGNEWFVREQMQFFAPGAVSVTETEHFLKMFTDGLVGDALQTPTLYELLGLRSHVSLAPVYRGASLLTTPEPKILMDFFATFVKGIVSD